MNKRLAKITKWIQSLPVLKQILHWSKVYSFPGFSGVPIYNIVKFIYKEAITDNITTRANSIAFSLFLSIFPFLIFLFTLLPILFQPADLSHMLQKIIPISNTLPESATYLDILREYMSSVLPTTANDWFLNIIEDIVSIKREGLLSFGFILAVFFASNGLLTLMSGFDKSYEESFKSRGFLKKRLVALGLTLLLALLFIISFIILIIGNLILSFVIQKLELTDSWYWIITIIKLVAVYFLLYTGITIIYRYGPRLRKRTPLINPGAILAAMLSILTSIGFSYFVNNFGRYNELYGSIGALIVILLWLQFNAFVILIGFELNASIAVNRDTSSVLFKQKNN